MTISFQTGSPAPATVTGSDPRQPLGSNSSSAAGDSPFQAILNEQQQQQAPATATAITSATQSLYGSLQPVMVNGRPYITQCYSYQYLAGAKEDVYEISGAQIRGMAVRIYDPSGLRPDVELQPNDDVVAVMRANNIPVYATDQGVSYEYGKLFTTAFAKNLTLDASSGNKSPIQLEAQVVQEMLGEGWSNEALAPWINKVASYLPTPSGASPASTGSLPLATADPVAAGVSTDPGSSTSTISALADTPVVAAQVTSTPEAAVASVAAPQVTSTPEA